MGDVLLHVRPLRELGYVRGGESCMGVDVGGDGGGRRTCGELEGWRVESCVCKCGEMRRGDGKRLLGTRGVCGDVSAWRAGGVEAGWLGKLGTGGNWDGVMGGKGWEEELGAR